jgi:hypothetical protein
MTPEADIISTPWQIGGDSVPGGAITAIRTTFFRRRVSQEQLPQPDRPWCHAALDLKLGDSGTFRHRFRSWLMSGAKHELGAGV